MINVLSTVLTEKTHTFSYGNLIFHEKRGVIVLYLMYSRK